MVVGGVHGDEPAGAWAAYEIHHWPLRRGKLIVLPRANAPGIKEHLHGLPDANQLVQGDKKATVGNLDRQFPGDDGTPLPVDSPVGAIWHLVSHARPDWVVDLHEGTDFHKTDPKSLGSSVGTGGTVEAESAATILLAAVNATVKEVDKQFIRGESPSMGSLSWAAAHRLNAHALVLETTRREEIPLAYRIRQHRVMLHALLAHLGMIDPQTSVDSVVDPAAAGERVRLAIYAGKGTRRGMHHLITEMEEMPGSLVLPIGSEEIDAGALSQFNVVLFPGGSSTRQGESLGDFNRQEVRSFVERGGGYVGICAGAYPATADFPWALHIPRRQDLLEALDAGRGRGPDGIDARRAEDPCATESLYEVRYHHGPILLPAHASDLPEFLPLATFRTEVAEHGCAKGSDGRLARDRRQPVWQGPDPLL